MPVVYNYFLTLLSLNFKNYSTCQDSAWPRKKQPGSVYRRRNNVAVAMPPAKTVADKHCRVQQHGNLRETRQVEQYQK